MTDGERCGAAARSPSNVPSRPRLPAPTRPDPPVPSGAASRRLPRWPLAAAVLGLAAIVAVLGLRRPERVQATVVERRDVVRTLVLTGRVRPPARPQVGATTAGTVRRVLVEEGDHVPAGALLVELDDAQARAAVAQRRAALATVQGRVEADRERAAQAVQQTTRDLARARALHAAGAISARDVEQAAQAAADARSTADAANARAASGALAEVAEARAALQAAEAQLGDARVRAPVASTVLARLVDAGDVVVPGQPLLELAAAGTGEIVAFASEDNLADLRVGREAVASADAYPAQRFAARVAWIAPAVDPMQGTVEVRLAVPQPPGYLLPDMTVSVNIDVARRKDAIVVPRAAVRDADGAAPWVLVAQAGRAVRRAVRVGIVGDEQVEITSGIATGERVLPADVEEGARVRVRD